MGAGEKNVFQHRSLIGFFLPKASTDIASGDAVKLNPVTGRLEPCTKDEEGRDWFAGFSDDAWSSDIATRLFGVGNTEYTAPVNVRLKVNHQGVVRVALKETSGKAGQAVYLDVATSGGMAFTTTRPSPAITVLIGHLEKDYSGATANDPQNVMLIDRQANAEAAIYQYLSNHVVDGLTVAFDSSSLVSYTAGRAFVNGQFFTIAAATAALGLVCASHASKARVVLYVINSAGAAAIVDTGTNLIAVGSATALADSQYWPKTSYLVFGAGHVGSGSSILDAGSVRTIRRSVADLVNKRLISN